MAESAKKQVIIYTDGGCSPNPGPGGYGVVLLYGRARRELAGGRRFTTNNRMELLAVIEALGALKEPCRVELFSDSEYIVRAVQEGWLARWKANGWRRGKNKPLANHDLWQQLDARCQVHDVTFGWVKGHANVPENERCDQLAMQALQADNLPPDTVYEDESGTGPDDWAQRGLLAEPDSKRKITQEGQPCRKCATPVEKRIPARKRKPGQRYYYAYYLYCPRCRTMYMVDDAKRAIEAEAE